jgi:chromosome segregation ATPase
MQEGFDVLVGQVRTAIDLIKGLRRERKTLSDELQQTQAKLHQLAARLGEVEARLREAAGRTGDAERLEAQLRELEQERLDVGGRVLRLTGLLESLDA